MSTVKIDFKGALKAADNTVVAALTQGVLSAYALTVLAKQAHWNIRSKSFGQLHAEFDAVYELADDAKDDLAERVRQLGQFINVSPADFAQTMTIPTAPQEDTAWIDAVVAGLDKVLADLKAVERAADAAQDWDTQDVAIEHARAVAKHRWFFDSSR